jgi:hypothetical protein
MTFSTFILLKYGGRMSGEQVRIQLEVVRIGRGRLTLKTLEVI